MYHNECAYSQERFTRVTIHAHYTTLDRHTTLRIYVYVYVCGRYIMHPYYVHALLRVNARRSSTLHRILLHEIVLMHYSCFRIVIIFFSGKVHYQYYCRYIVQCYCSGQSSTKCKPSYTYKQCRVLA